MSSRHKGDSEDLYQQALGLAEGGKTHRAVAAYASLVERPDCPDAVKALALNDLGCLHHGLGDRREAIRCLMSAISLAPESADIRANLEALTGQEDKSASDGDSPVEKLQDDPVPGTHSINIQPKKHILYYSLESKSRNWFPCYGGPWPAPNFSRLARMSQVFEGMTSTGCSTSFVLSSTFAGRFPHEFDRANYDDTTTFDDNLIRDMTAEGRRCYVVSSDLFLREYWTKIYPGDDVTRIEIPEEEFTTMLLAKTVARILQESEEPCFIFSHPFPLKGCDPSLKPSWRNGMERYIWDSDQALGYILDHVDLDECTLLVCADHGNSLGENHHLFSHAFYPYDTQVAVPCMVTGAGTGRVEGVYSTAQIRDLLRGREISPPEHVFMDTLYPLQPHRITAVRFDDWKYIAHYHWGTALTGLQEELYDVRFDPGEHRNLLADRGVHPLRSDWNSPCIHEHLGGAYGYDTMMLKSALRRGRREIADIWRRGFLTQTRRAFPAVADQLTELFERSDDLAIIQNVGRLASEINPGPICYEKLKPGCSMPTIPVPVPHSPQPREFSPDNFATLDRQVAGRPISV